MEIQLLSIDNLKYLTELALEFWTDSDFEEEFEDYKNVLESENEICYLVKEQGIYIAFIQVFATNTWRAQRSHLSRM
jgi:aminoglycoside 6'-N-acetyltransferase I